MKFEGRIFKKGKLWLAEILAMDYLTQGKSANDALLMAKDIVETGVAKAGFEALIEKREDGVFLLSANDPKALIAHMLKRLRQKHGMTVREASANLNSSSPNAFGVYEQGKAAPTLQKLEELIRAVDPEKDVVLKIA